MARDYIFQFGSGNPTTRTGLAPTFILFIRSSDGATQAPPSIAETYSGSGFYKVNYNAATMIHFCMDGATTGLVTSDRYISGVFDPQDQFGATLNAVSATLAAVGATLIATGSTLVVMGNTLTAQGIVLAGIGSTQTAVFGFVNGIGSTLNLINTTLNNVGATVVNTGNLVLGLGSSFGIISGLIGTAASSFGSTSVDPTTVFGFLKRSQEFWEGNQTYTKTSGILDFYSRGSSTLLAEKTIVDTTVSTTKT